MRRIGARAGDTEGERWGISSPKPPAWGPAPRPLLRFARGKHMIAKSAPCALPSPEQLLHISNFRPASLAQFPIGKKRLHLSFKRGTRPFFAIHRMNAIRMMEAHTHAYSSSSVLCVPCGFSSERAIALCSACFCQKRTFSSTKPSYVSHRSSLSAPLRF